MQQSNDPLGGFEHFRTWLENAKGLAPTTAAGYSNWAMAADRWLESHFGRGLAASDARAIQAFHESTKATSSTRRSVRIALVHYFNYLQSQGNRDDNPATALTKPRVKRGVPKPIPQESIPLLYEAVARSSSPEMWTAVLDVFLKTGLRVSEVCSMRWNQIDGQWLVITQKGGHERSVPLPVSVLKSLAAWKVKAKPSVFVFPSPVLEGKPVDKNWLWRKIKEFGDEAGIEGCRPHRLRHTFATGLYAATGDVMAVRQALGHTNIQNTMRYTQVRPEGLLAAVEALSFGEASRIVQPNSMPSATNRPTPTKAAETMEPAALKPLRELMSEPVEAHQFHTVSAYMTPRMIIGLTQAFIEGREQIRADLPAELTGRFDALCALADDMRRLELVYRGRLYLLRGAAAQLGLRSPDYEALAVEAAMSVDNELEEALKVNGPEPGTCSLCGPVQGPLTR